MTRSIFLSLVFHSAMIVITAITLPFMKRAPIDLPPILSVDLIQITDKTSIPFAANGILVSSVICIKSTDKIGGKSTGDLIINGKVKAVIKIIIE